MNHEPSQIIGAYNFKDWHMSVWASIREVKFPEECACCGCESGLQREKIPLSEGRGEISYPLCPECRNHAVWDDRIIGAALALGFVIPAVVYFSMFGFAFLRRGLFLTFIFYVLAGLICSAGVYFPFSDRKKSQDCSDSGWAVSEDNTLTLGDILGKGSERTDEKEARFMTASFKERGGKEAFGLQFKNQEYALKFLRLNGYDPEKVGWIAEAM